MYCIKNSPLSDNITTFFDRLIDAVGIKKSVQSYTHTDKYGIQNKTSIIIKSLKVKSSSKNFVKVCDLVKICVESVECHACHLRALLCNRLRD